jgi:signal transduction histidine kinase
MRMQRPGGAGAEARPAGGDPPGLERPDIGPSEIGRPEAVALRGVEVLVVGAVWGFYAVLNVVTGVLYPQRGGPPAGAPAAVEPRQLVMPAVWAVLTLLVLWLSRRVRLDRAFWRRRALHVLAFGVLAANVADAVSDALWDAVVLPAAGGDGRAGARRFRPGPGNLTWLDDFGVFLAAAAAATARGYVLRERARREEARRREAAFEAHSARLQAQLAEARLDALRRQLDPHFLFNTLNAVSALVERDPRGVRRMIGQLSDLLRHSMDDAPAPEVPLRQELGLLERYVDIMRVRFDDQLAIGTRADPRALDALVPNMILQPLVENAIRHGVERRADGGRVEVDALLDGDTLVLRVRDDGPGVAAWAPAPPAAASPGGPAAGGGGGVGLRNTAARLAQLYGDRHRLSLAPDPGGGTVAEVRLPYHTRPVARAWGAGGGSERPAGREAAGGEAAGGEAAREVARA